MRYNQQILSATNYFRLHFRAKVMSNVYYIILEFFSNSYSVHEWLSSSPYLKWRAIDTPQKILISTACIGELILLNVMFSSPLQYPNTELPSEIKECDPPKVGT